MPENFYQRLIDKYEPMTEAAFLTLISVRQPIKSEDIPAKIATLTDNKLQLGLGTLFTNLHAMTKDYLMTEHVDEDDVHTYEITGSGESVLEAEYARLKLLNQICEKEQLKG
ncbi:PadR family transcriptional regulator [Lactiplantibacillus garii]|uniref:PadR family transcriptional regulator n=1 Tax=Lactiplantibacillus garii TaxID=2306423 RepID=A0A3R8J820_9LACO|nr:helix-turn-helix transcriptional regulator [Lactiplantibacillus garii]RRK10890.1 PadR family transcriptional regulator [Lactiplantibacillus garii]